MISHKIIEMGATDSGEPLHLVILIRKQFNLAEIQNKYLLINNGIHAGEPMGLMPRCSYLEI
jgi:hypothetical protein